MQYILPQELRNALLEYMEQREDVKDGDGGRQEPNEEMCLASMLRDLRALKEVA